MRQDTIGQRKVETRCHEIKWDENIRDKTISRTKMRWCKKRKVELKSLSRCLNAECSSEVTDVLWAISEEITQSSSSLESQKQSSSALKCRPVALCGEISLSDSRVSILLLKLNTSISDELELSGILLRFRRAGKTFPIKSANNAVQRCALYLLRTALSLGLRNTNSHPSFKYVCSFPQNTISEEKGSLITLWKREFNFNIHRTVKTINIIRCVWW